jgi:hypothetical protein
VHAADVKQSSAESIAFDHVLRPLPGAALLIFVRPRKAVWAARC